MNPITIRFAKKSIAASVSGALLMLSPGPGVYEALAQFNVQAGVGSMAAPGGPAGAGLSLRGTPVRGPGVGAVSLDLNAAILPSLRSGTDVRPDAARTALFGRGEGQPFKDAAPLRAAHAVSAPDQAAGTALAGSIQSAPVHRPKAVSPASLAETAPKDAPSDASLRSLLSDQRSAALPAAEIASMGSSGAKAAGVSMMDRILGLRSVYAPAAEEPAAGVAKAPASGLNAVRGQQDPSEAQQPAVENLPVKDTPLAPSSARGKVMNIIKSLAAVVSAGAAVYGLQALAVSLLPAVFGVVPVAALWAVSSGVLLLPVAIHARYRLRMRDSPRLRGVKIALDLFIGGFLGAAAVAAPAFLSAGLAPFGTALPVISVAAMAMGGAAKGEGAGGLLNKVLTWVSLALLPPILGVAAAAPLTLGAVFGLLALPAMTTISFYLGRIIASAESGRAFQIPGSMQAIRFPSYTWVLTGVVFALLTGYSPVWVNAAFAAWMFLGNSRIFNWVYGAAAAWAAFTGFAAPLTFLVIAFAPERAAHWTEGLLGRLLRQGKPAPSTSAAPEGRSPSPVGEGRTGDGAAAPSREIPSEKPERWPAFRFWLRTGLALGSLLSLGALMSATVFSVSSFFTNLGISAALSLIPLIFSRWLIKKTMKAEPTDAAKDPEVFAIMGELRGIINESRRAKGKKEIPMPEIVNVGMGVPNAFATGMSPMKAMVGVTYEIKKMLLDPETLRQGLNRLLSMSNPNGKSFDVFRTAIRGSVQGIPEGAGPEEVRAALKSASQEELKALGYRALRGVLGHEFSHVMNRDMLLGGIAGTLSSAVAFSSYGVLWAVGHAKEALRKFLDLVFGRGGKAGDAATAADKKQDKAAVSVPDGAAPESVSPRAAAAIVPAAGAAVQAAFSLLRIFAALWGPIIATILQMASTRTREGAADEDGALLTRDPAALALGLGLLTTWRPAPGFTLRKEELPLLASQAHAMTVNPIEQLHSAGALPRFDALTRWAVGKEDDFFFNLFITHPDTTLRIERLRDMQKTL